MGNKVETDNQPRDKSPTFSGGRTELEISSLLNYGKNDPKFVISSGISDVNKSNTSSNKITEILAGLTYENAVFKDQAMQKDEQIELLKSQIPISNVITNNPEFYYPKIQKNDKNLNSVDPLTKSIMKDYQQDVITLKKDLEDTEKKYKQKIEE